MRDYSRLILNLSIYCNLKVHKHIQKTMQWEQLIKLDLRREFNEVLKKKIIPRSDLKEFYNTL